MSERVLRRLRLTAVSLVFGLLLITLTAFSANYPAWWSSRGVVQSGTVITNDFAPVNQGQLKWFVTQARNELDVRLPGGAGSEVATLVASFSLTNNYLPVNAGQLKAAAKPFYDRLIAAGLTNGYPWTTHTADDDRDFALINQGQVKYLFSFAIPNNAPPVLATISGTITYTGPQTGTIWVVAVTASNSWATGYNARLSSLGTYTIANLSLASYWIKAWRDSNGDGINNSWEAVGTCPLNPTSLVNDRSGRDIQLVDPDTDFDSLPDWWELLYFGNTSSQSGADNYDNDGLTNLDEYTGGSNPTSRDYRLTLSSSGASAIFNLPEVSWYPSNSQVEIQATPCGLYEYFAGWRDLDSGLLTNVNRLSVTLYTNRSFVAEMGSCKSNLLLYYSFDRDTGNGRSIQNECGTAWTGTRYASWTNDGKINGCVTVPYKNDFEAKMVVVPSLPYNGMPPFVSTDVDRTLCAWIKLNDVNNVLCDYNLVELGGFIPNKIMTLYYSGASGKFSIPWPAESQYYAPYPLVASTWYFVTLTIATRWDSVPYATYNVYINGQLYLTAKRTTSHGIGYGAPCNTELMIGHGWGNNPVSRWNGQIDELMVYDGILSATQIQELYKRTWANHVRVTIGNNLYSENQPAVARLIITQSGVASKILSVSNSLPVSIPSGATVTVSINDTYMISNNSKRVICLGYTGTGQATNGSTSVINIPNLTQHSTVSWRWQTNYWANLLASGDCGRLNTNSGWYPAGTIITNLAAIPDPGANFIQWTAGVEPDRCLINPINVAIKSPTNITAKFSDTQGWLIVSSLYGSPNPVRGTNIVGYGLNTASVNSVTLSTTQYVCVGWTGSGSVPVTGATNSVTFNTTSSPSTIAWRWATNYLVTTSVTPSGYGCVSNNLGWYRLGATATVSAVQTSNSLFRTWTGTGISLAGVSNNNPLTFVVTKPVSLTANFETSGPLIVQTTYGTPSPGSTTVNYGTPINASISSPVFSGSTTQYVSRGWTGSGSVPANGYANAVSFTFSQPSSIYWSKWATNYLVTLSSRYFGATHELQPGGGTISNNGYEGGVSIQWWCGRGSNVVLTAIPASDSIFLYWTGFGCSLAGLSNATVLPSFAVTNAVTLTAVFAQESDGDGIPNWWESRYGLNPYDPSDAQQSLNFNGTNNLAAYLQYGTNFCVTPVTHSPPASRDRDGDGLSDEAEHIFFGTDGSNRDTDGDGVGDGDEILINGTDPLIIDTDGGGVPDGYELYCNLDPLNSADDTSPCPMVAFTVGSTTFSVPITACVRTSDGFVYIGTGSAAGKIDATIVNNPLVAYSVAGATIMVPLRGCSLTSSGYVYTGDGFANTLNSSVVVNTNALVLFSVNGNTIAVPACTCLSENKVDDWVEYTEYTGTGAFAGLTSTILFEDPLVLFSVGNSTLAIPASACTRTRSEYAFAGRIAGFGLTSSTILVSNQWSYLHQYQSGRDTDGDGLVDAPNVASHVVPLAGYQSCWLPSHTSFAFAHADLAGFCRNEPDSNTTSHVDTNGDGFSDPMEIFAGTRHSTSNSVASFTNQYAVLSITVASPAARSKWGVHMGTPDNRVFVTAAEATSSSGYACVPQSAEPERISFTLAYTNATQRGASYDVDFALAGGQFDWVIDPAASDLLNGTYPTDTNALVHWGFTQPSLTMSADRTFLQTNETGRLPITINLRPSNAPYGALTLDVVTNSNGGQIEIYTNSDASTSLTLPYTWTSNSPACIWVKATAMSASNDDTAVVATYSNALLSVPLTQRLVMTVVDTTILWAHKYAVADRTNADGTAEIHFQLAPTTVCSKAELLLNDAVKFDTSLTGGVYTVGVSNVQAGYYALTLNWGGVKTTYSNKVAFVGIKANPPKLNPTNILAGVTTTASETIIYERKYMGKRFTSVELSPFFLTRAETVSFSNLPPFSENYLISTTFYTNSTFQLESSPESLSRIVSEQVDVNTSYQPDPNQPVPAFTFDATLIPSELNGTGTVTYTFDTQNASYSNAGASQSWGVTSGSTFAQLLASSNLNSVVVKWTLPSDPHRQGALNVQVTSLPVAQSGQGRTDHSLSDRIKESTSLGTYTPSNIAWSVTSGLGGFLGSSTDPAASYHWTHANDGITTATVTVAWTVTIANQPITCTNQVNVVILNEPLDLTPTRLVVPATAQNSFLAFRHAMPDVLCSHVDIRPKHGLNLIGNRFYWSNIGVTYANSGLVVNIYGPAIATCMVNRVSTGYMPWYSLTPLGCATVYVCSVSLNAAPIAHAYNSTPGAVVLRSASTSDCSRLVPISLSLQPAAIPFGTLSLDLTGATTNYLVWTNAAKCGASFNTSTNWPATNFPATLYIEGVTTSSVVRDLAWTLSYWTNTAVGTPVVTDLLYTTVMDLTLDAYQPDKTTAITNEARHALGMVLSPNTVDADTNGVRDEADAVFNGAADTNAMGVVIFRQMVGITNFIGLSNVYVQVAGPIRLFRPGATNREPCLVSGGASLDIASQISTGDVRMLVEAAAGGSATITLSLANVISDYVNVTVLPVPTDSDVDGICEQGGGSLNIPEVTSVEPVSLLPWSSVQLGRGSLPCGLTVAAYLTCWYVPTNDATFLRQNMYNLDTQVLPDSGDGCTRVVRPNGRVVSFNANGLPQMPDLGRTYRLVGSRAAGYTLVFASGYKHLFDAAGDLSKIEDPNGTTFGTSDNNWPTVSSRTNADLVAAIDSPNYGTNGTLTCKLSYDTTNHLIGVSSDYTTLTRSQTNGTWYLHTVAGTAARDTSLNINDLTIRRTDDVPEIWKRKNSGTRIHDSICDRSGALTHYAIACEDAGDRICQIARLGAYSGGIAEITTTFGIQTNVTVAGFGQVQWIVSPNGGFTYQTYDSLNRVTNILASLGPARQDRDRLATATPPAMANCRATTFDYTGVGNDGNRDEDFNRPRTITDYYQGTAVSRAYYVYASSSRETKATVNPADEYSDTSNLTTSVTFGSGTFAGFPSSLVDPCENTTTFDNMQHDNGVKVTASVDDDPADEGTITYYDEHGWVTRIDRAHSGNSVVTLSSNVFDSLGHLLFTFYPDGRADAYQYNDWGACTQSSNRESVVTTYAYDALLRLTNTVCNGVTNRYTDFDSFGNARTITTMGGNETRTVTRTYDKAGRLLSERAPFVGTTCYDVQLDLTNGVAGSFGGQLQSITRGNHTVTNEYYRDGTLAGTYGNSAHPVSYEYGLTNSRPFSRAYYFPSLVTSNRLVPITTPTTATITRLSLDAAGLQQQIVFGDGHAILTTCDNNGRVTCRQDENKHRVFTSYDPAGRVQRTTLDLNNDGVAGSSDPYEEQTYAFATHHGASVFKTTTERLDTPSSTICVGHTYARTDGQGVWSVDADNKETYTKTTYSGTTRTRKIDLPNGQNATVKFDQGLLTSYKPAASAATTTIAQRDGLLRPIKVVDTKGSTTVEYAPSTGATNYTKVTKPTGGYTKCSVDAYGQATTRETRQGTNTLTTTCDWNMTGEPTKLSGGNSQPLQFSWSGDGWFDGLTTSRNGNSATNGATTTTTDKTSWELDPARRWPVAKNYSDGARIQTPRDAVGNLRAWIGARSITNTYSRDPADQITGISYSDGTPGVSFLYNLRGLITNLLDAAGSHDFVYDNCNRLTSETGTNMSLTMKYCTNSDERASMILAIGAADVLTLDYTFGSDGRLTAVTASQSGGSVSGLAFRYAWDTNENRIATVCAPNGLTNQYQYQTNADLVSAIRIWGATPSAAPILAYTYTYDDADRCTNFARPYESRRDLYAYNSAGYLIKAQRQVTGVWSTAQWCFDTAGNRVSEINGITGRSATQAHNALNQLRSCSYDLDGNLTANGAWSYTWDAENRLTSVKSNGTLIATYQYDAYNRRISKIVGTTTHTYLYDSWNLVAETISNPQSTITNLFVWGADHTGSLATDSGGVRGLLAIITGGTAPTPSAVYYPVMNNHGDVMALFDATGTNIVARYERDPFGVLLSATGPAADACPFGFQTKYCDPETGLIYFGHRYYEPTLAAWLCRDPLEEEGGVNLYGVTGGDPVNGIDPLGLADLENHVLVGAAALCQLGIELEPSDFESFARGLMLPDIPFADVNGIASGQTEIPLAVVLTLKMELSKIMKDVTATTTQIKKELKQKLLFLDWNDPRNWIPGLQKVLDDAAEPKRRVDYWWADSSIVGPALKRIPWVNQTTTVRTHFGDLAYYHGMGDTDQSATELQHNIQTVVEKLLNGYRENRKTNPARAHIQLGMAVHILTDTWTPGHTIRDDEGIILLYQDYNVQSLHFHAENDDLSRNVPREFASATRESAALIQMAMASKAVDAGRFFINDPNARIDLKPGTDQATLWRTLWFGIPRGGTK